MALLAQPRRGREDLLPQVLRRGAADVLELDILELVPDALVRIEIRRVARQGFELQALAQRRRQEILDRLAPMNRSPIPQHEQLAGDLLQELVQKPDDIDALVS